MSASHSPSPEPGAYEVRGAGADRVTEGVCAACEGDVTPADSYVIRYSLKLGERGGIFHRSCEPKGPQWYALDAVEAGPEI